MATTNLYYRYLIERKNLFESNDVKKADNLFQKKLEFIRRICLFIKSSILILINPKKHYVTSYNKPIKA